ncbi:bacteriocin immunity protein [Cellulophaga sp. E16_2]|uniref:bacteriocin immunity protein n=1 Tax=Cellulophaga sp. E16_2 TaxID=2789297 RepID=UPI001A93422F|nr:bacteriocin immunity protein [Cellulophaga sp. E16_2]MBO0593932.1 bacteriocin immunity protein [Cellulophaga sp. E16_2]
MSREELIEIAKKIIKADCSEQELNELENLFDKNIPYPNGSNLFYWPENYDFRKEGIENYNPTIEEVVDKCLSYKPIIL